jgi:hypothetical protein
MDRTSLGDLNSAEASKEIIKDNDECQVMWGILMKIAKTTSVSGATYYTVPYAVLSSILA